MIVLAAFFITLAAVLLLRTPLMHAPAVFYVLAVLGGIACTVQVPAFAGVSLPGSLSYVLKHGSVAYFLFAIVMYVGVLPDASRMRHYLMPVRGKLSILASLVACGHFAGYLGAFAAGLFSRSAPVASRALLAFALALALCALLAPLAVTSVAAIRDKMTAVRWKRLQQWAYVFFAFLYAHVAVMLAPTALRGGDAALRFACYTAVFVPYVVLFFARGKWGDLRSAKT